MSMTMDLIRHIAGLYSGKAIKGDFTQVYITGNEIWMAQQILASQQGERATAAENAQAHSEQAEGAQGKREAAIAKFAETCPMTAESAAGGKSYDIELRRYYLLGWEDRAAMAQPSPAPKSDMQRVIESWEELSLGAHLYRCCVGVWNNLLPDEEAMPEYRELRKAMDDWENGKPSPAPELERPQSCGPMPGIDLSQYNLADVEGLQRWAFAATDELTAFDRIVGALRADRELWAERWSKAISAGARTEEQRDAAQARVAELEQSQGAEVFLTLTGEITQLKAKLEELGNQEPTMEVEVVHRGDEVDTPIILATSDAFDALPAGTRMMLYAAPVAQAGQVPDGSAEFSQFLSAVMDAAGLVRHGRRSKELSEYLGAQCMKYRLAAAPAQRGDA